jgi:iron complex outermembrane receptor protein
MNSPLSYIDPTAVEAIQVSAGVTPVSVGGDSIGGTIEVESAAPTFAAPGGTLVGAEVGAFYRDNGNAWGSNLAATLASERLSLSYTGAYAESGNYRAGGNFKDYLFTGRVGHTLPLDEVGSTAYRAANQSAQLAWRSADQQVTFGYARQDLPYEAFPNQRMDMTDNQSNQFNLAYRGDLDWGVLEARTYYQQVEHAMDFGDDKRFWYGPGAPPLGSGGDTALVGQPCAPIAGVRLVNGLPVGCAAGMPMETDAENTGLALSAEIPVYADHLLRIGAEYQGYRLDDWWPPSGAGMWPDTFYNINDGLRDRYAAFGEWEVNRERWSHILGIRYEAVDTKAGPVHGYNTEVFPTSAPVAGVTLDLGNQIRDAVLFNTGSRDRTDHNLDVAWIVRFNPDPRQTYELGIAQKTRSPNLYERYTWSTWQMAALMNNFVGDGNGYVGDPDLDPEIARTLNLSGAWQDAAGARWGLQATVYVTLVEDYIDAVQWDGTKNAPRTIPVVDDFTTLKYVNQAARLYGIDLAAQTQIARGTALGDIEAELVASYTRGQNTDTDDDLYNIMPLNATLALSQESGPWRSAIEGEFVASKDAVSSVRNEMKTAGYGLVHLRGRYARKAWSLDLGVENLLDRSYDLPLGGAYVGQGTTMTIPPLPNQPQWGTPVPGPGRTLYAGVTLSF